MPSSVNAVPRPARRIRVTTALRTVSGSIGQHAVVDDGAEGLEVAMTGEKLGRQCEMIRKWRTMRARGEQARAYQRKGIESLVQQSGTQLTRKESETPCFVLKRGVREVMSAVAGHKVGPCT